MKNILRFAFLLVLASMLLIACSGAPQAEQQPEEINYSNIIQPENITSTTPLFDIDGDAIGYVYEYQNGRSTCYVSISVGGPDYRGTGTSIDCP